MELGLLTVLLWKSELYKVFHIIFIGQFLCKFLGRVLLPSHLVSQWLVRGGPGALSPLLRLRPHLLISGPGLLIAEPMLLQQYGIYFFVSELIALVTVLKSHYYEAWFVVFSWFLQFYVYLWQNWNPVNFSFTRWIVWQIKCTNLVFGLSPRATPHLKPLGISWRSHDLIVGWGGDTSHPFLTPTSRGRQEDGGGDGVPTASRPETPATHFHFNHWVCRVLCCCLV